MNATTSATILQTITEWLSGWLPGERPGFASSDERGAGSEPDVSPLEEFH